MNIKKSVNSFLIRTLLAIIMFFSIAYFLKDDQIYLKTYPYLFASDIDFSYIKSKTNILLGNVFGSDKAQFVSSIKLNYKGIIKEGNHHKIITDHNYVINNLYKGVVIFIGNKEKLGKTVIVASENGINYWYSHIENISVNLYDQIPEETIIGSTVDDYFYLTLEEGGNFLNYDETHKN